MAYKIMVRPNCLRQYAVWQFGGQNCVQMSKYQCIEFSGSVENCKISNKQQHDNDRNLLSKEIRIWAQPDREISACFVNFTVNLIIKRLVKYVKDIQIWNFVPLPEFCRTTAMLWVWTRCYVSLSSWGRYPEARDKLIHNEAWWLLS